MPDTNSYPTSYLSSYAKIPRFFIKSLPKDESIKQSMIALIAAGAAIPFWWPFFEIHLRQRAETMCSCKPGSLTHLLMVKQGSENYRKNLFKLYITMCRRGILTNMGLLPLYSCVQMGLSKQCETIRQKKQREPNILEKFLASSLSGALTVLLASPVETMNLWSQKKSVSFIKAFKEIVDSAGVSGFYRAFWLMALRNGLYASLLFTTVPELTKSMEQHFPRMGYFEAATCSSIVPSFLFIYLVRQLEIVMILHQSDPYKLEHLSLKNTWKEAKIKHGSKVRNTGLLLRGTALSVEVIMFNWFLILGRDFFLKTESTTLSPSNYASIFNQFSMLCRNTFSKESPTSPSDNYASPRSKY